MRAPRVSSRGGSFPDGVGLESRGALATIARFTFMEERPAAGALHALGLLSKRGMRR